MAYNAKAVANSLLDLAAAKKSSLTPMKLQKLIFFAHGWHLALYGTPLIADQVEAWQFGPVIPAVYHAFKHERLGAISSRAFDLDLDQFDVVTPTVPDGDEQTLKLLRQVLDTYGKLSAVQLSNLTHLPGTPWDVARKRFGDGTLGIPIDDAEIADYFRQQADANRAKREQAERA